jgi:hypothetical protein
MKTKLALGLVLVLILSLSVGLMGCKVTGGGFLENREGDKATFGFNVQGTTLDDVKGKFQLVDHSFKPPLRIHGTFFGMLGSMALGECTINGEGPFLFQLYVDDAGEPGIDDYIYVRLFIPGPDLEYEGIIDGGNIQVHE